MRLSQLSPIPTAELGETEITTMRTERTKTFRRQDGSLRLVMKQQNVHYNDAGTMKEINCVLVAQGNTLRTTSTPYVLSVNTRTMEASYTGKSGNSVTIRLIRVGGVALSQNEPNVTPILDENEATFPEVKPGLDIVICAKPNGIEIFKRIKSSSAPHSLVWRVIENGLQVRRVTQALDNENLQARQDGRLIRIPAQVSNSVNQIDVSTFDLTETLTTKTLKRDAGRKNQLSDEIIYPVIIDVTVNEDLAAAADDGALSVFGTVDSWRNNRLGMWQDFGGNSSYFPGWRYQTVPVPNAASITSATLTIRRRGTFGGTGPITGTLHGDDVDDAAVWSVTHNPRDITPTTASASIVWASSDTEKVVDITSIVQEIVNRGGWASDNDMAFGVTAVTNPGTATYMYMYMYDTNTANAADLQIIYTAAAGATLKSLMLLGVGS